MRVEFRFNGTKKQILLVPDKPGEKQLLGLWTADSKDVCVAPSTDDSLVLETIVGSKELASREPVDERGSRF